MNKSKEYNLFVEILIWIKTNEYNIVDLKFEILNKTNFKHGFNYVIKPNLDIQLVEKHLLNNNINIQFINNSTPTDTKKYLTVFKK